MRFTNVTAAGRSGTRTPILRHSHPDLTVTRCASYVGRLGVLAIALGIGLAVPGAPGLAWADDAAGSAPSSADPADAPGAASPHSGMNSSEAADNNHPTASATPSESSAALDDDGSPPVKVGATRIGATSVDSPDAADPDDVGDVAAEAPSHSPSESLDPAREDATELPVESPSRRQPSATDSDVRHGADTPTTPRRAQSAPAGNDDSHDAPDTIAAPSNPVEARPDSTESSSTAAPLSAADVTAAHVATLDPATATAGSPATPLSIPETVVHVALDLVSAVLSPLGPGAPTDNPVLLAILAWGRRQYASDVAPQDVRQAVSPAATDLTGATTPEATAAAAVAADTGSGDGNDESELALENLVNTAGVIPGLGNVLSGFALAIDILQFAGALSNGDRVDLRDEAGDLAGDITALVLDWPLDAILDDVVKNIAENIAEALVDAVLGSGDSGPGGGGAVVSPTSDPNLLYAIAAPSTAA